MSAIPKLQADKAARLTEANKLIRIISTYGRRFFYNEENNCVAEMLIGPRGHIFFIDDYSRKLIYVAHSGRWPGWSHGGTLRDLVKALANYVRTGEQLSIFWISPGRFDDSNIWGYAPDEMTKCRAEALTCAAIKPHPAMETAC